MNSLATLFILLALISYIYARCRLYKGWHFLLLMLSSVSFFGLLAVLSKETALLLPLFILLVEFCFFAKHEETPPYWKQARMLALLAVLVAAVYKLAELFSGNWSSAAFMHRFFTLEERTLTEARILWTYWQFIMLPNIQSMGLHLDDVALSRSLFSPISTFIAVIGHIGMLGASALAWRNHRVLSFGILWFYTGHLLESTIFPLELMYEHRNYLPMLGPIFSAVFYGLIGLQKASTKIRPILIGSAFILPALLAAATTTRAIQWGDQWQMPFVEAAHHPNSTRANYFAGRACGELMLHSKDIENKNHLFECALSYLRQSAKVNHVVPEPMVALAQLYAAAHKPLPETVIKELKRRLSNNPLGNDGASLGKGLLELGMADESIVPDSVVTDLFVSTLQNQKLSGIPKSHILVAFGIYLCEGQKTCHKAIEYFEQAVETSPEIQFMTVLSTYYLRVGRHMDAISLIKHARSLDLKNVFEADLSSIEKHAMLYLKKSPN
jgi:hypothetical protein